MAIFHFVAKIVSRGKGQSAIAAAAYRSGDRLRDEATGEIKEYKARRERIEAAFLMVPSDAPEWAKSRNALWNKAEQAEKRKDAQLAREIEIALPHELTAEQREWLVRDFAREAFVRKGYAVDIAIHAPDKKSDERNHHAHLLISMRTLKSEGFAAKKDRSLNTPAQLEAWREKWAHLVNRHLERHGHSERVDHRSLKAQGIDREAGIHLGYAAHEMMQRGEQSDRAGILEAIQTSNRLKEEIRFVESDLKALEQQKEQAQKDAARQVAPAPPDIAAVRETYAPNMRTIPTPNPSVQKDMEREAKPVLLAPETTKVNPPPEAVLPLRVNPPSIAPSPIEKPPPEFLKAREPVKENPLAAQTGAEKSENRKPSPSKSSGLQVEDRLTGGLSKLGDFVTTLLAGLPDPIPAAKPKFTLDNAERKRQQMAALDARRREREADEAFDRLREDMKRGKNISAQDIHRLPRDHLLTIQAFGDDGLRRIIEDHERSQREKDYGRERERD